MLNEHVVIPRRFSVEGQDPPSNLPSIPAHLGPFVPRHVPAEFPQQEMDDFVQEIALGQKADPQAPVEEDLFDTVPREFVEKVQAAYSRRDLTSKEARERDTPTGGLLLRGLKDWVLDLGSPKMCEHTAWQIEFRLWEIAEAKKAWKAAQKKVQGA